MFHFGSLGPAFCQGIILGGFVHGVNVDGRDFSGGSFDWDTAFSIMTGIAVVFGYALLGATWLVMKTTDITQLWSRKVASYVLVFVALFMGLVSITVPFINEQIKIFWFSTPNIYYLSVIPFVTSILFIMIWHDLHNTKH